MRKKIYLPFALVTGVLVFSGFWIFISASLGLLAREDGAAFSSVAVNQILFGLVGGGFAAFFFSRSDHKKLKPYIPYVFAGSVILMLLTFVPGIGVELKGASRWLSLGGFSFQPSELFKGAAVLLFARILSNRYREASQWKRGLIPCAGILALAALLLLLQPDTDTLLVIALALLSMLFAAGGRMAHILLLVLIGVTLAAGLFLSRPYLFERITTFIHPERDPQGSGYQIQQSLIAIGSGGLFGKGFGQSTQKFNNLPEPIGDSIFAVAGEEFGFLGGVGLLILYLLFIAFGLRIASRATDSFGGLASLGLVILIGGQSFINIASSVSLFPLSGMPLLFVSHGGTALLMALAEAGIIMSVSRSMRTKGSVFQAS